MLSFEQCFILLCSFPLLFAFGVGGLGFEFCVFVAGWRHALRSEWPFIIIIIHVLVYQSIPVGMILILTTDRTWPHLVCGDTFFTRWTRKRPRAG